MPTANQKAASLAAVNAQNVNYRLNLSEDQVNEVVDAAIGAIEGDRGASSADAIAALDLPIPPDQPNVLAGLIGQAYASATPSKPLR